VRFLTRRSHFQRYLMHSSRDDSITTYDARSCTMPRQGTRESGPSGRS
jgi:hypothetical protein